MKKLIRLLSVALLFSISFGCKAQTLVAAPEFTIEQLNAAVRVESDEPGKLSLNATVAAEPIKNISTILNAIADEQGVEPGSPEWTAAGIMAYSGQTGGHGSYGWNHACRLDAAFVRAVIANYAHRCVYYLNAPLRSGSYLSGGRPQPYSPQFEGDLPGGEHVYKTSKGDVVVSGPDVQHFQMGPLFAVADSSGYTVKAQGKDYPAEQIAGLMIRMLMTTSAGQIRSGKAYLWGDRGSAITVQNFARAAKRGLVEPADAKSIQDWFLNSCLPYYEKAPGFQPNTKSNGLPTPNHQVYNGIFYLMPAFREALDVTSGTVQGRIRLVLKRWSQWCVDLNAIAPDYGFNIAAFSAPESILKGTSNGSPVDSLQGLLTKDQILKGDSPWDLWGFYSAMIAQEQLGDVAKPLCDKLKAKWLAKPPKLTDKVYLIGADGKYVISMLDSSYFSERKAA